MSNEIIFTNIFGVILTVFGYLDGYKYFIEARKIVSVKTSHGHSRKFINIALANDVVRLGYFFVIDRNIYLIISAIVALVFMCYMFWQIYWWYPYRNRTRYGFKRPNLGLYIVNSLLPNSIRKKL
jgi:hypothetical protein